MSELKDCPAYEEVDGGAIFYAIKNCPLRRHEPERTSECAECDIILEEKRQVLIRCKELRIENAKLKEMLESIRDLTENGLHAMTLSTPVRIRLEELNRTLKGVVTLANSVIPEGD